MRLFCVLFLIYLAAQVSVSSTSWICSGSMIPDTRISGNLTIKDGVQ